MVIAMEKVKLILPKRSEYISTIRLTTSALSNIGGDFNIDIIEDLKVIVSEICIFFINNINNNDKPLEIEYLIEKNLFKVIVTDLNEGEINKDNKTNSEMCMLIIESLSDRYEIDLENKKLSFEKNLTNIE